MNPRESPREYLNQNQNFGITIEKTKNLKEALSQDELRIINESLKKLQKSSGNYREKIKIGMVLDLVNSALYNRSDIQVPPFEIDISQKAEKLQMVFSVVQIETILEALNKNKKKTGKNKIREILERVVLDS